MTQTPQHIQFVCLGNICRSPMADVIFRALAEKQGYGDRFEVTSSGIGNWHEGDGADPRTVAALARAGYDGSAHVAHQVTPADVTRTDLFIALDRTHLRALQEMGADNIKLLSEFDSEATNPDVFDPYHSDDSVFDDVLTQIERSCSELLKHVTNS